MSASDDLINFRTAYLRMVARAWADSAFRTTLIDANSNALETHFRNNNFDLDNWEGLELDINSNGPEWKPDSTGGWFGQGFSSITLRLPLNPARLALATDDINWAEGGVKPGALGKPLDESYWAEALAAYYQLRPTLFGAFATGAGGGGGTNNQLGGWQDFLEFGAVTLRAVALAWTSIPFRQDLTKAAGALPALQGWLRFVTPWNLDIFVEETMSTFYFPGAADKPAGWYLDDRNRLLLDLPQTPAPTNIQPVALAAYNNSGAAYPFTCCA